MLRYTCLVCERERLLIEPPGRRRRVGQLDFVEGHDGAAYQAGTPMGSMGAWEHGSMGALAMSWASQCDVNVDTTFAGDHSSRGCEF
jgi:hypothetical protein